MNERIKELAEQADTKTANFFKGRVFSSAEWRDFYDKEFAKLIVEECCQICVDKWVEKISEDARDCYLAIQEHFKIGPNYERED